MPSEADPLGVDDWLTDKDILCWWDQQLYNTEIDEPRAWILDVAYVNRESKWMHIVELGSTWTP